MTKNFDDHASTDPPKPRRTKAKSGKPGWADGLRKFYDGVVAEPLPDSFEDLLKKLDQTEDG